MAQLALDSSPELTLSETTAPVFRFFEVRFPKPTSVLSIPQLESIVKNVKLLRAQPIPSALKHKDVCRLFSEVVPDVDFKSTWYHCEYWWGEQRGMQETY